MNNEQDYIDFRDRLLVAIADEQEPPGLVEVDLFELCQQKRIPYQETWVHLVGKDLERLGYGRDGSTMQSRRFMLNGAGLEAATVIRRARRPKGMWERVRDVPRSDWIALGAFLVALVALFR